MKIEKIAAGVLGLLVAVFFIIYFTLPEQGEQIYIPEPGDGGSAFGGSFADGRSGGKLAGQFRKCWKCWNGTGVRVIFLISRLPEVNLPPA